MVEIVEYFSFNKDFLIKINVKRTTHSLFYL